MDELHAHYDTDKYPVIDSLIVRPNVEIAVASKYVRSYFANTTSMDNYIGKVMDRLREMDLLDNTIIVFSADHGEMLGSQGLENKNVLYTEAMAIPFLVHWPDKVKPGKTDVLLGSPDIFPTLANLAGIKKFVPDGVEGKDLSTFIKSPTEQTEKPKSLLLMLGNSRGLQTDRYTLVIKENKKQWDAKEGTAIEEAYLFNNETDPYQNEKIPLEEKPEVSKELLNELAIKLKMANDPWFQAKKYPDLIPYSETE